MYISLAALGFTLFAFFEEKINKMDSNLTRAEWLLLIFLWGLTVLANRNKFYRLWADSGRVPHLEKGLFLPLSLQVGCHRKEILKNEVRACAFYGVSSLQIPGLRGR